MTLELSHNSGNAHLARAELMIDRDRWDQAEQHLRLALADDPDIPQAHAYLAICLLERQQPEEATREAERAIALDPMSGYNHFVRSFVMTRRDSVKGALASIEEALRLDPHDARYWAHLGAIHIQAKRYQEGLDAVDNGLSIDPDNRTCINLRALALRGMGRKQEASSTVEGVLAKNPEDPMSHANLGWSMLHQGMPKPALVHFREALRLNPEMDWAKAGLVEAMKARYWPYRIFLAYFLFMGRLTGKAQWAIVLGGYFGFQVLRGIAAKSPAVAPWVWPIMIAYLAFALGGWLAMPLSNLLLRFHKFGRYALSREQAVAASALGAVLAVAVIGLVGWAAGSVLCKQVAVFFGLACIPVAVAGVVPAGPARIVMIAWSGIAVAAAAFIVLSALVGPSSLASVVAVAMVAPFIWACLLSLIGGNLLSLLPSRRG